MSEFDHSSDSAAPADADTDPRVPASNPLGAWGGSAPARPAARSKGAPEPSRTVEPVRPAAQPAEPDGARASSTTEPVAGEIPPPRPGFSLFDWGGGGANGAEEPRAQAAARRSSIDESLSAADLGVAAGAFAADLARPAEESGPPPATPSAGQLEALAAPDLSSGDLGAETVPGPQSASSAEESGAGDESAEEIAPPEGCPFEVGDLLDDRFLLIEAILGKRHLDAVTFRAFDTAQHREVEVTLRPIRSAGVARAAQLMARLDHPSLARCLEVGSVAGLSYLVTECAGGPTLAEIASHAGRFQPEQALRVVHRLAQGLRHAERRGVPQDAVPLDGVVMERGGQVRLLAVQLERRPPAECFARVVPALGAMLRALLLGASRVPPSDVPAAVLALADRLGDRAELFDFTAVITSLELTAQEALGFTIGAPEVAVAADQLAARVAAAGAAARPGDVPRVATTVEVVARCQLR